jgi:hypothetical protein
MARKPRAQAPAEPPELDDIEIDDPAELPDEDEPDEDGDGEPPEDETDEAAPEDEDGEGDGETIIGFADDPDADGDGEGDDNSVIRRIPERNKELARENAELRKITPPPAPVDIGPKPTLADCNFDEEVFEAKLDEYKARKAQADAATADQAAQQEAAQRAWQSDLQRYETSKAALSVDDFDEAIDPVKSRLTLPQQAVIVKAANDPAAFAYALGGSDARLS